MEKLLSIVVPAYNMESCLGQCLESLLCGEAMDAVEVLVVNDGSTDQTGGIARSYQERFPDTFAVIDKENGGHGSAINAGIRDARGRYLKVVDADDWLDTEALPGFVRLLGETDADIAATDFVSVQDGTGRVLKEWRCTARRSQYGHICDMAAGEIDSVIKMHSMTIRTDLLRRQHVVIDEHCYYVDMEFVTYPIPEVKSVYFYPCALYRYRLGRDGQSMDIRSMQRNRAQHERVLESLLRFYGEHQDVPAGNRAYIAHCAAQVAENQFQIYVSMGRDEGIHQEAARLDARLKRDYPEVYRAVRKKSIALLRMTDFRILPEAAAFYGAVRGNRWGNGR